MRKRATAGSQGCEWVATPSKSGRTAKVAPTNGYSVGAALAAIFPCVVFNYVAIVIGQAGLSAQVTNLVKHTI
jgi:hypothetical protein